MGSLDCLIKVVNCRRKERPNEACAYDKEYHKSLHVYCKHDL